MSKKKTEQTPLEIELPHTTYQPSMAQVREKFDMPEASPERIRRAFFRPVVVRRKKRRK
ncbi:MAG: hypothetical protein OXN89_09450 [Bryobacterales bacterium]|nr:hypothetical protein [Bryobacterales bacterium]